MQNDDRWEERKKDIENKERDRLKNIEEERRFLKDKSIGGNAPRPSDDFIDRNLGPKLEKTEIDEKAKQKAKRQAAQEQKAERARNHQVSTIRQRDAAEKDKARDRKERRLERKTRERSRSSGRGRDEP